MKRYGRSEIRQDYKMARSIAVDSQWRAAAARDAEHLTLCEVDVDGQTEHEQRVADDLLDLLTESVALVSGRYLDPECRYLRHPAHTCHDRDGQPLRQHASCWLEARLQILEQGAVTRAANLVLQVRP